MGLQMPFSLLLMVNLSLKIMMALKHLSENSRGLSRILRRTIVLPKQTVIMQKWRIVQLGLLRNFVGLIILT